MVRRIYEDLFKPHVNLASLLLRLGLAAIFLFHGYLKLVQDGGMGWQAPGLEPEIKMAVAWGETACGAALLVGLLSRLAALGITIIQIGAISLYTWRLDFIHIEYNKNDPQRIPVGSEYNVALIVMALAVIALGSGMVSLDYFLFGRHRSQPPVT